MGVLIILMLGMIGSSFWAQWRRKKRTEKARAA